MQSKLLHLHCTSMKISLVAGIPTPLLAVHLYPRGSFLLMLINGMVTAWLSESLIHVMVGFGFPSARHFSVTFPPSNTFCPVMLVMLDETESKQRRGGKL